MKLTKMGHKFAKGQKRVPYLGWTYNEETKIVVYMCDIREKEALSWLRHKTGAK